MVNYSSINKLHKDATIGTESARDHAGTDRLQNSQQVFIEPNIHNRILICHHQDNTKCR